MLRTESALLERARLATWLSAILVLALEGVLLVFLQVSSGVLLAITAAVALNELGKGGWTFALSAAGLVCALATQFHAQPLCAPVDTGPEYSQTISSASASA
ncbi:hypothetical protein I5Q34_32865 [Streptomyces sp. AV19]|uniref:hypothetical protein n=1 Tax=Streptomyces sp. AV19 TaxID=2793068 RepID=UPI0018FE3544|nr:hypothetical protein [Streptomyces sp. AV19]MBH1938996.1 hypothetical protein [Streptomyces sp. AV19]MDG4536866.1 hypothetical protein [Streptomyces sp. AV19]